MMVEESLSFSLFQRRRQQNVFVRINNIITSRALVTFVCVTILLFIIPNTDAFMTPALTTGALNTFAITTINKRETTAFNSYSSFQGKEWKMFLTPSSQGSTGSTLQSGGDLPLINTPLKVLYPKSIGPISFLLSLLFMSALPVFAVSGGGFDYAGIDISGQDFSNGNYKGKDFTQVIAKATTFSGSNLQGCRFYKAYLVRSDFTNADIRGASLEDTSMEDADLSGAIAVGAYFSASLKDVKSLTNADFTDAQIPPKALQTICNRPDAIGTNPKTGTDTRESLMCL